jgi:ParB/RepB/Spo0J family partition protein
MSPASRRSLTIDDPTGRDDACHVARLSAGGQPDGRLREIPVEDIRPNPDQPRKHFDEKALRSLADSIRERGVLQPIIVRTNATGGYQLIAGERRWRAAQLAGRASIPALIDTNVEGAGSLELALIENVVREDLTPIEEARTIAVLLHDLNVTATELAKRLGRSRADLAHTVRLLDLPDQAIDLIDAGALSKGHGKALLTEPDHHRRRARHETDGRSEPSRPESRVGRTHARSHQRRTQTTRQLLPDSRRRWRRRPATTPEPARIVSATR